MKRAMIAFILAAVCLATAAAQQNQSSGTSLTIYNSDLAVARTTVDLNLKQGMNEVTTTKVTSQVEPDSVVLRDASGRHTVQVTSKITTLHSPHNPGCCRNTKAEPSTFRLSAATR